MVKIIPLGGENIFKVLLTPLQRTPEVILGRKKEFLALAGAGVAFLFTFKLLMWNIIPKIFQVLLVGIVAGLLSMAMFPLIKMQNENAKGKNILGIMATLFVLLLILLVL